MLLNNLKPKYLSRYKYGLLFKWTGFNYRQRQETFLRLDKTGPGYHLASYSVSSGAKVAGA
jgi:hypothetical protein